MKLSDALVLALGSDTDREVLNRRLVMEGFNPNDDVQTWTEGEILTDGRVDQYALEKLCPKVGQLRGINVVYFEEYSAVVNEGRVLLGFQPAQHQGMFSVTNLNADVNQDLMREAYVGFYA